MDNPELEQRSNLLRQELKAWEKQFATEHDGRKAERDDIKAEPTISQKYKEYNKLRDVLAGKVAPQTPSKRPQSRKLAQDADRTPKAHRGPYNTTPVKRKRDSAVDLLDEAAVTEFLSPQGPAFIGPTPQRNGIAIGLFDLLPVVETPSKRRAVLVDVVPNALRTPCKTGNRTQRESSEECGRLCERTPQSVGKRFMLDQFTTPQKRKRGDEGTPTSASRDLATPAFLRRDNFVGIVDDEESPPRRAPWKLRTLGRSLSSMIRSRKKQEEERFDEEADIMREMEMEAAGISIPKKSAAPKILVPDSQVAVSLGPDGFAQSDDENDHEETTGGVDQNGNPLRVWKKRGLKRQTRRVIMRPHIAKAAPQPSLAVDNDSEAEVQETQANKENEPGDDCDSGSEYASDHSHTPKKRKTVAKKKAETKANTIAKEEAGKPGPVRKAVRKVKATANANYRKLKIKSKGGNGGGGRRFGRR